MKALFLTSLTMIAFAANSVLNRMALLNGDIDPVSFGTIRLISGAVMLAFLVTLLRRKWIWGGSAQVIGVLSLVAYIYGFSAAYTVLDAGVGALILFGMVQITMFGWAVLRAEEIPAQRWIGALLAAGGLAWLLWPGGALSLPILHAGLMAVAGIAWGAYSLAGRGQGDPLVLTALNFMVSVPIVLVLVQFLPVSPDATPANARGIWLAVISGAVTSGLGYALWYSVLPNLPASVAAVAQLTVPVIALLGGMLLLGEMLTLRFAVAAVLVLGGVAWSVVPQRRNA